MTVTMIHTGFHGRTHLRFHTIGPTKPGTGGNWYPVSYETVQRLTRAVCGQRHCQCGEGVGMPVQAIDDIDAPLLSPSGGPSESDWYVFLPFDNHVASRS